MIENNASVIDPTIVIRRSSRVAYRHLADGAGGVLLHLDTTAYHGINEVGALVWELLGEETTFERLIADLTARLVDAPTTLPQEISGFLEDLEGRDLVAFGDGMGPSD
jgi:hypothetical protein